MPEQIPLAFKQTTLEKGEENCTSKSIGNSLIIERLYIFFNNYLIFPSLNKLFPSQQTCMCVLRIICVETQIENLKGWSTADTESEV